MAQSETDPESPGFPWLVWRLLLRPAPRGDNQEGHLFHVLSSPVGCDSVADLHGSQSQQGTEWAPDCSPAVSDSCVFNWSHFFRPGQD